MRHASHARPAEIPIELDSKNRLRWILRIAAVPVVMPVLASFDFQSDPLGSVLLIVLLILSLGVHEAAHAWSAWKLGDSTGKDMGRMTLNPIVHIDLFMTILLPALCLMAGAPVFGGAKPVPVNFHRLRKPWTDMTLVALAGPFSNFLLSILFFVAGYFFAKYGFYNEASESFAMRQGDLLPRVLLHASYINVTLFVFNLIPIPPLDGSRLLVLGLPDSMRETYLNIGRYGLFILLALMQFSTGFRSMFISAIEVTWRLVQSVATQGGAW